MSKVACLPEGQIERLAKLLGECGSGSDITRVLVDRQLTDDSGQSTKWRRLYWVFLNVQQRDMCANRVLDFVQSFLTPTRFVGRREVFEQHRSELNTLLAFSGSGRTQPNDQCGWPDVLLQGGFSHNERLHAQTSCPGLLDEAEQDLAFQTISVLTATSFRVGAC